MGCAAFNWAEIFVGVPPLEEDHNFYW